MHALIMAGGAGSRINLGEKPLVTVCGRPMIAYILDAFIKAGIYPVVATSSKTPMTMNWCRALEVRCHPGRRWGLYSRYDRSSENPG